MMEEQPNRINQENTDEAKEKARKRSSLRKSKISLDDSQNCDEKKPPRRVSFASSNFVKPFASDPEVVTIWDNTYEEVIEPSSENSSGKSHNKLNLVDSKHILDALPIDKENIPVDPMRLMELMKEKENCVMTSIHLLSNQAGLKTESPAEKTKVELMEMEFTCVSTSPNVVDGSVTKIYNNLTMDFTCLTGNLQSTMKSNLMMNSQVDSAEVTLVNEIVQDPNQQAVFGENVSTIQNETIETEEDMELSCQIKEIDLNPKSSEVTEEETLINLLLPDPELIEKAPKITSEENQTKLEFTTNNMDISLAIEKNDSDPLELFDEQDLEDQAMSMLTDDLDDCNKAKSELSTSLRQFLAHNNCTEKMDLDVTLHTLNADDRLEVSLQPEKLTQNPEKSSTYVTNNLVDDGGKSPVCLENTGERRPAKRSYSRLPGLVLMTPTKSPVEKYIHLEQKTPNKNMQTAEKSSKNLFVDKQTKPSTSKQNKSLELSSSKIPQLRKNAPNATYLLSQKDEDIDRSIKIDEEDLSLNELGPMHLTKASHSSYYLGITTPNLTPKSTSIEKILDDKSIGPDKPLTLGDYLKRIEPLPVVDRDAEAELDRELRMLRQQNAEVGKKIRDFLINFKVPEFIMPEPLTLNRLSPDSSDSEFDSEIVENEVSLGTKIRNHYKESDELWELESVEDNDWYHFYTLNRKLKFQVQCNPQSGVINELKVRSELSSRAKPVKHFITKLFLERFEKRYTKAAIGDKMDILSLLDYVQITMTKLMHFLYYMHRTTLHGFEIDQDFIAKIRIIDMKLMLNWVITMDFNNLDAIDAKDFKYDGVFCDINANELINLAKACPKGIDFLETFVQEIRSYLETKKSLKTSSNVMP